MKGTDIKLSTIPIPTDAIAKSLSKSAPIIRIEAKTIGGIAISIRNDLTFISNSKGVKKAKKIKVENGIKTIFIKSINDISLFLSKIWESFKPIPMENNANGTTVFPKFFKVVSTKSGM